MSHCKLKLEKPKWGGKKPTCKASLVLFPCLTNKMLKEGGKNHFDSWCLAFCFCFSPVIPFVVTSSFG